MPLSADFSRLLAGPAGRSMYADFRPDVDWPGQYGISYRTIATNIVNQVRERAPQRGGDAVFAARPVLHGREAHAEVVRQRHFPVAAIERGTDRFEQIGEIAPVDFRRFGMRAGEIIARGAQPPRRRPL